MADEAAPSSGWVVQPPEPGQIVVQIAAGEGVEFDEEQRAKIDALMAVLQGADEVSGFRLLDNCAIETCAPRKIVTQCLSDEGTCQKYSSCTVTKFF